MEIIISPLHSWQDENGQNSKLSFQAESAGFKLSCESVQVLYCMLSQVCLHPSRNHSLLGIVGIAKNNLGLFEISTKEIVSLYIEFFPQM